MSISCLAENPIDSLIRRNTCLEEDCDRARILPIPAVATDEQPKRSRYIIISNGNKLELYKEVERKLDEGWELQGGVATTIDNNFWETYHQAMVRLLN